MWITSCTPCTSWNRCANSTTTQVGLTAFVFCPLLAVFWYFANSWPLLQLLAHSQPHFGLLASNRLLYDSWPIVSPFFSYWPPLSPPSSKKKEKESVSYNARHAQVEFGVPIWLLKWGSLCFEFLFHCRHFICFLPLFSFLYHCQHLARFRPIFCFWLFCFWHIVGTSPIFCPFSVFGPLLVL